MLKHPRQYGYCPFLTDHFNEGVSNSAPYSVYILENIECSSRTKRGAVDALKNVF